MSDTSFITPFIIGTRGSDLALAQSTLTKQALAEAHPNQAVNEQVIKTIGDQRQDLKLTEFASQRIVDKGIFTKELEVALAEGSIHAAVHSLKDVPTVLDEAFAITAVLPREDTRDVLITKAALQGGLEGLPQAARLATSSVRRQAQLQWHRPDLRVEEIRGNVPTRLRKLLADDGLDGILLAMAGLKRLHILQADAVTFAWDDQTLHVTPLAPPEFLPACGQGAVALEILAKDEPSRHLLKAINHQPTWTRITVERLILERLDAGCHTPVGVHTWFESDQLSIHARVFDEHALMKPPKEAQLSGSTHDPIALVDQLMVLLN